jgi:hypothetical protein
LEILFRPRNKGLPQLAASCVGAGQQEPSGMICDVKR